jgi:hypothetical protein
VNVDADQSTSSAGSITGYLLPNQVANKVLINLPQAEKNFYLRIAAGATALVSPTANRTDHVNVHSVKYYSPNSASVLVASVAITGLQPVYTGDTLRLGADCQPGDATSKALSWTSSNTAVATVTGGVVVALTAGTTRIAATAADGGGATDTVTVTVAQRISVTTVNILNVPTTGAQLRIGDSLQIQYEVLPENATDKTVTFSSANLAASVSATGVITPLLKGWAEIHVTSNDPAHISAIADIQVLNPVYAGGEPVVEEGAPKLPMLFSARTALSPTVKTAEDKLDETWAKNKWFEFAVTGLRAEKTNDSAQYYNMSRMQGVYANEVEENGATADFANIGLKTTKAAGRQTRLIFAYDGVLDSLKLGIVVGGSTYPSTVAVQESNDGLSWNELFYICNAASSIKENEPSNTWIQLTENVYTYPVITGFNPTSRYIRLWQLESGAASGTSHNIYLDGIWLYGAAGSTPDPCDANPNGPGCGETGIAQDNVADHGVAVYPNPVGSTLYLSGAKALSKVEVVSLASGAKVKSAVYAGVTAAEVPVSSLTEGAYLVLVYVEGSSKPQVVKITKQ